MALVVLLRGVNVGGHKTFRPTALVKELEHLDAVNIGAAGTFVVRKPVTQAKLRAELASRLPFETEVMIFEGREISGLFSKDRFAGQPARPDIVRFVTFLPKRPPAGTEVAMSLPAGKDWLMKIVGCEGRCVFGMYRRHPKVIGYIGTLDRRFGGPGTTRNWNTITAIAKVLDGGAAGSAAKRGSGKRK